MPAPGLELGRASGESVGAAYCEFILFFLVYTPFKIWFPLIVATNNPNGNFIVASDIGSDGKVVGT